MNVLESPLEALAFNYLNFGFVTAVNNLWTWVAVITAAVSFWRIKTAGGSTSSYSPKPDMHHQPRNDPNTTGSQPLPEISPVDSIIEPPAPAPAAASDTARSSSALCDVKDDGDTKGKFTLYYHEEEREESSSTDGEITAVIEEWGEEYYYYKDHIHGCEEWWERVMRVRVVDMGWRHYQDSTVISGNIVRLWDDECMRRERHSSSCAVW
ncbi:hypothetical protein Dsin_018045 [Dipteronia sinensis]|uniref:Uncharacterized protein n=1 Tax=Dipteronia sinensis TaxID=43782 RepID=A0AAE0AG88_9ROSI|nr:hypothetical protein Dsin_018045 [Dipteronia sinensis]